MKPETISAQHDIVSKRRWYSQNYGYMMGIHYSSIHTAFGDGTSSFNENSPASALTTGIWQHIAVTYDKENWIYYLNGEDIGSDTHVEAIVNNDEPLTIGCRSTGNDYFKGLIDEVKIYSRALTAEEIQADYEAGSDEIPPDDPDDPTPPATGGAVSGTIMQASDGSGITGVTVNLMQDGSVIASTVTDSNGDYLITDVPTGEYTLNVAKVCFWPDSTSVTVFAGETVTAQCTLWLKGDLNNNGVAADKDDLAMMVDAVVGKITPDWKYDLNENGIPADAADQAMMIDAAAGKIILE